MSRHRIRAHYEQLSEFQGSGIIGLKEAGWANKRIACHMGRSDAAITRYWQKWVNNGRFQRHDGSGRPKAIADQVVRLIVRSTVTAPNSSLSTIRHATGARVSTITIRSRLIEQHLHSYLPLRYLPPTLRQRPSGNCFSTFSFAAYWPYFHQDNAKPHTARVAMNCLTACRKARSFCNL
ncbi:HTH_Tnp_Tc3_2 domain-containing protein [Trichonephila clavipes]|nr:HTH_Tnp_Tc3_2 domain-containing protein [Trichonephila clavipes]